VPFIQKHFRLSGDRGDFLLGLAVSCLGWGVLGGTAVAGSLSDRFGRKKILIATAVFFTGSALLSALTTHFSLFVFSRILGGVAVGGHSNRPGLLCGNLAPETAREPRLT
jgi:predicted MFS family arabinose efflux permease